MANDGTQESVGGGEGGAAVNGLTSMFEAQAAAHEASVLADAPSPTSDSNGAADQGSGDTGAADAAEHAAGATGEGGAADSGQKAIEGDEAAGAEQEAKDAVEGDDVDLDDEEKSEFEANSPASDKPFRNRWHKNNYKAAKMQRDFMDTSKEPTAILDRMHELSPMRAQELEGAVLAKSVEKPAEFRERLWKQNPDLYSALFEEGFNADPDWYAKQLAGAQDATAEELKAALPFYRQYKDKGDALLELSEPEIIEKLGLSENAVESLKSVYGEDWKKIVGALSNQPGTGKDGVTAANKVEAESDTKGGEAGEVDPATLTPAQRLVTEGTKEYTTLHEAKESVIDTHVQRTIRKDFGLVVSAEERSASPAVAQMKDFILQVAIDGMKGILNPIELDFKEWATGEKGKPATKEAVERAIKSLTHFSLGGESANARGAAKDLIPYLDSHWAVRKEHPILKSLLQNLKAMQSKSGSEPHLDEGGVVRGKAGGGNTNGARPALLTTFEAAAERAEQASR